MTLDARSILRPGITGLFSGTDPAPPSAPDLAEFKVSAHAAVRSLGGRMTGFQEPGPGRSFFTLTYEIPREPSRHILHHACFPYLAAADNTAFLSIAFAPIDRLIPHFPPPLILLPPSLLNAPFSLTRDLEPLLGAGDLYNIRYWKPKRLGDLIFNHYD